MGTKIFKTRCFIIHANLLRLKQNEAHLRRTPDAQLLECIGLASAIDLDVVNSSIVNLKEIKSATYFGAGVVKNINKLLNSETPNKKNSVTLSGESIDLIIVNSKLSPIQQRNLEREWHKKVIDRTGLILEIFGSRAITREGRLQVDLASMTYLRSRLVRTWTHLERQRGGAGFLGGPGETQIETDRRLIDQKIIRLKNSIKQVVRTRDLHRKSRRNVPFPIIALVGYTNAGKSTLFNKLTSAKVRSENQLFVTLDPTMRRLELPSGTSTILSDTVGFISSLPHELIKAFQATLEEVKEADIILHVRDVSHPDNIAQSQDVVDVLTQLGVNNKQEKVILEVLNKIDLLNKPEKDKLLGQANRSNFQLFPISAFNGQGLSDLVNGLDEHLKLTSETIKIKLGYQNGDQIAWLYKHGNVTSRKDNVKDVDLTVSLNKINANRFRHKLNLS